MIDVIAEQMIDLKEVSRLPAFSRHGQHAHISTVFRWVQRGARDANGQRVRLEVVRTPSGMKTSIEAVQRFVATLTDPDAAPESRTPTRRQKDHAQADRELAQAGW